MESGPDRLGRLIEETLESGGIKKADESVEGKIEISQEELIELNAKAKEAEKFGGEAAVEDKAEGWHEKGEPEDFREQLDKMAPVVEAADDTVVIEVEEQAMKSVESERNRKEESDYFGSQREKFQKGEINLDDAANSVLRLLALSIAEEAGESDPKRMDNMIQQSRGMMKMHLKGSGMSDEAALDQVRSFMTKLLGGKEKVQAEVEQVGVAGQLAGEVERIRKMDESQRGKEIRAMLESAARELLGGDVDEKKVSSLAERYDGLVRTFFKIDQMSSDEIASQLDRQMRQAADKFSKSA